MEPTTRRVTDLLAFADRGDIDEFVAGLRKFESGEMSADDFRGFRLARGTYGQRQMDVNMLRIKIPQGILTPEGLAAMATIAEVYSRGFAHITTRQNVQIHMVKLDKAAECMELLAAAGLTTKEACGNTVRNVTACALAGVCQDGAFDVTPYGQAITRHFLRNPICQSLPRKFKISLSGCEDDCAMGAINDVGLIARMQDGERGFRIKVGGGLSTSPENAHLLADFVPVSQLLAYCEAVLRVFDANGNRKNKSRARLKYVIRKEGFDGFKRLWQAAFDQIVAEGRLEKPIEDVELPTPKHEASTAAELAAAAPGGPGFARWRETNVLLQRQPGYAAVTVRLERGDITAAQMRALGPILQQFGDGTCRTTIDQNLVIRFVPEAQLGPLHMALSAISLGEGDAGRLADVTACPGADTCNLAVTGSRELAQALTRKIRGEMQNGGAATIAAADHLGIKISGCPNSCGQHHIASIGFHGTVRRVGNKVLPEYQIHLGGGIDGQGATFGRQVVKVPSRRVPDALIRLLELYRKDRHEGEDALAFFRRVDEAAVKLAVKDLTDLDEATLTEEDFTDIGSEKPFVVAIGAGECAA